MKLLVIEVVRYGDYFENRYQRMRDLGYDVHVLYGRGDTTGKDPRTYRQADTQDLAGVVAVAQQWHASEQFGGITTLAETSVVATAHVAESLHLNYVTPMAALSSRNKYLMRKAHEQAGVPHPAFLLVQQPSDIARWPDTYPAIVKPTLGSASTMVFKVNNRDELEHRCATVLDCVSELPIFNLEATGMDLGPNAVLIEEFLDGNEFLLEGHVSDNTPTWGSIVDRITLEGDTFDDDVHHAPTELDDATLRRVLAVADAAVQAQGLNCCTCHVEIRFSAGQPCVVEAAARPGGGSLDVMAKLSYGYDPLKALTDLAWNGSTDQHRARTGDHTVAACVLSPAGRIHAIDGVDEVRGQDDVYFFNLTAGPGTVIQRPPKGNDIAGFLGVKGTNYEATRQRLFGIEKLIHFTMEEEARP